jgi:putative oxidoreductase
MLALINRADALIARIPEAAVLLFIRIAIGHVFWASGETKTEGFFHLRPEAVDLFREEYKLPFVSPEIAAPMAAAAEHILPILLFVGLFTRFAALGLVVMTLIIQFLVYPEAWWPVHSLWLGLLLALLARGGGSWSLDHFLRGRER